MSKDVAHAIPEPAAQFLDDFVNGMTASACVAAVLEKRHLGVGLPYAVTVSIFGGTAESVALWCKSIGHERWFYYYLTVVIATSFVVYITMRDTGRHGAMAQAE